MYVYVCLYGVYVCLYGVCVCVYVVCIGLQRYFYINIHTRAKSNMILYLLR